VRFFRKLDPKTRSSIGGPLPARAGEPPHRSPFDDLHADSRYFFNPYAIFLPLARFADDLPPKRHSVALLGWFRRCDISVGFGIAP